MNVDSSTFKPAGALKRLTTPQIIKQEMGIIFFKASIRHLRNFPFAYIQKASRRL